MEDSANELLQTKCQTLFRLWASMREEFKVELDQEHRFLAAIEGADFKACCALIGEVERRETF